SLRLLRQSTTPATEADWALLGQENVRALMDLLDGVGVCINPPIPRFSRKGGSVVPRTLQMPESDDLKVQLITECKSYALSNVACLLQTLLAAGEIHNRIVYDCIFTLTCQQRLDGSFGYSANDLEDQTVGQYRVATTAQLVASLSAFYRSIAPPDSSGEELIDTAL
ncbi:MAG: hypothetical protein ACREQ5_38320, partial [Candidatus Dormibacteria bacterium]